VSVKPGYANNYLLPNGLATVATDSARKVLAENLKQRAHKDAKILADAQALAQKLEALDLVFEAKAEDGKIFGSITSADVAKALADKGIEIDRKVISLEPVKMVGEYNAAVRLHKDVKATVRFSVMAEAGKANE
jgi:large subunit ribosomal protein L9